MTSKKRKPVLSKAQKKQFALSLLFSAVVLLCVFVFLMLNSSNPTKALAEISKGDTYFEQADYANAIKHFTKAMNYDSKNEDARIKLANTYELNNRADDALTLMLKSVKDAPGSYSYYQYIIQYYVRHGNFDKALSFINSIKHPPVLMKLNDLRPRNISFDPAPGSYDKYVTVTMSADEGVKLYYTTDGSTPTAASAVYSKPIYIEAEKFTLKVLGVNSSNLISDEITSTYNIYNENQTYTFSDSKIEQIVRGILNKPTDPILYKEVVTISGISNFDSNGNAIDGYIRSLSDLSAMRSLSEINFVNEPALADFSAFSSLQSLKLLNLTNCGIDNSDLVNICQAKSIETITLDKNQISDLSPLSGLDNLQVLSVSGNSLSDISSLSSITSIKSLTLSSNTISSLSPLSDFTALTYLDLGANQIEDISPLLELTSVKELKLNENKISSLTGIKLMTGLKKLSVSANPITDLSAFKSFNGLEELDLSKNNISDLSPIEGLSIKKLLLTNCNITDISSLSSLSKLEYLDLKNTTTQTNVIPYINNVIDLSPLSGLESLQVLILNMNQSLTDLSPLKRCSSLQTVYCISCPKVKNTLSDSTNITVYTG